MVSRRTRIGLRWLALFAVLSVAAAVLLAWYGLQLVDTALRQASGSTGTRVLSAPLVLRRGDPWSAEDLLLALSRRGFTRSDGGVPGPGEYAAADDGVWLGAGLVAETVDPVRVRTLTGRADILTAGDRQLSLASVRPVVIGFVSPEGIARWHVPLAGMAPPLLTAVVDTEDQTFLTHPGLSLRGLLRAAASDLLAGGVRQGGSTITQQLAKILILRPSRTFARKILEAWLAALIEYRYDKRTILESYLNRIYLGQDGGREIQGVGAAAAYYFGKEPGELREAEAALLAGLIAAPNRFDPFTHPAAARGRREVVLNAMVQQGHVDAGVAARLSSAPLPTTPRSLQWAPAAQAVGAVIGGEAVAGDLASSIDVDVQHAAQSGAIAGLTVLERRSATLRRLSADGDPLQVAAVVIARDGRVLGLIGSRTGTAGEFNRALAARRQIGSLVKPFVVVEAVARGRSLEDTLLDEPLVVATQSGPWRPANSDGRFRGPVSLRRALVESLNVPMVRLGLEVGVAQVASGLGRVGLGVGSATPAILLGAVEATPLEVARAYAALVSAGRLPEVTLHAGAGAARSVPVLDPGACRQVVEALEDVVRNGTAAALGSAYAGRLAAKTGTSDDRRDSWFVALRSDSVAVVWLGTDANRETGLYGATGAMEVWREIDRQLPPALRR